MRTLLGSTVLLLAATLALAQPSQPQEPGQPQPEGRGQGQGQVPGQRQGQFPGQQRPQGPRITVTADREDATYSVGDTVTFNIAVTEAGQPVTDAKLLVTIQTPGGKDQPEPQPLAITGFAATLHTKAVEPGFVWCVVTMENRPEQRGQSPRGVAAVAVDPLKIMPVLDEPKDFDAFWADKVAELKSLPLEVTLTPTDRGRDNVEVADVEINCTGPMPVRGYFARPVDAQDGKHPALLTVQGAGVRSSNTGDILRYAAKGFIAMDINAHGLPNGQPSEFYSELNRGELADYNMRGATDRETYYFLGMYQRVYRALQFLKSRPEWDGHVLVTMGHSQGGAQALIGGGLDPDVSLVVAHQPALCDHGSVLVGRTSGWPDAIERTQRQIASGDAPAERMDQVLAVAGYYDAVNFAKRIKNARVVFGAGFRDTTCPPENAYAAHNSVPHDHKIIYDTVTDSHSFSSEAKAVYEDQIMQHVATHGALVAR